MAEIYALKCPDTNVIKYIGKANDSQKRLKSHLRDSKNRNTPVYKWIRSLSEQGKCPNIEVLLITDNWQEDEIRLISQHPNLLNVAKGGNEPHCDYETRAENGRNNSVKRDKRIWKLKLMMGQSLKFFKKYGQKEAYNKTIAKLHTAATKRPDLFGDYLKLQTWN